MLKMKTNLYVLEDAAKLWFDTATSQFNKFGLKQIKSAPCIFHKNGMIVICYVDYFLSFVAEVKEMEKLRASLSTKLTIKDLGVPK